MSISGYIRAISLSAFIVITASLLASCDSDVNQCFGVNLEQSFCPADTIVSIGQERGLTCIKCTGQETGDRFSIYWNAALLAETPDSGTLFGFVDTPDAGSPSFPTVGR